MFVPMKKQQNMKSLWPYDLFGIECKDGWKILYEPILDYVTKYNKDKQEEEKLQILQIKEKWGHLELYFNFYTDELNDMVNKAYEESAKVCEDCGSRCDVGMVIDGWLHSICLDCLKKEVEGHKKTLRWQRETDGKIYFVNENGLNDIHTK